MPSTEVLISVVVLMIPKWVVVREDFTHEKMDCVIRKWKTCIGLGHKNDRVIASLVPFP